MRRVLSGSVLLVSFALAIQIGPAYGQQRPNVHLTINPPEDCYVSDAVGPENIDSFLKVQILALSLAQRGERANSRILQTKGGAPLNEMDAAITGMRQERIQNICASFVVSYYKTSRIPDMAKTALLLANAYDEFAKMSNEMLGIDLQKTLSQPNGPSPQLQLSRLMERREQILRDMTDALNVCLEMLVDPRRTNADGKPDHLILTKSEVKDLLDFLYSRFSTLKNQQEVSPTGDFIKQAAIIRNFLTGVYKPADVP